MADLYEPYFGYDADSDEDGAAKLRGLVERLLAGAAEDDTSAALAASVLRNAQTYEELRPTAEGDRSKSTATIDELLAQLLQQHPDLDYLPGTKRQGKIELPPPPPPVEDPTS